MNPRTRRNLIIAAGIVLVIIVAVVVWWLVSQKSTPVDLNTNITNTAVLNTDVVYVNTAANEVAPANTADAEELELIRLANMFAERYGSYSTEAGYQNITDLKQYMTQKMQVVSDSFVTTQKAQATTGSYTSVTATALSTSVSDLTAVKATVRVSTQRREIGTNINGANTFYQALTLNFIKDGDTWLVDNAAWGDQGSY